MFDLQNFMKKGKNKFPFIKKKLEIIFDTEQETETGHHANANTF